MNTVGGFLNNSLISNNVSGQVKAVNCGGAKTNASSGYRAASNGQKTTIQGHETTTQNKRITSSGGNSTISLREIRNTLSNSEREKAGQSASSLGGVTSILESTQKYGQSLRADRSAAKDTSLKLRSLKYNFKNISSKILRSKTSASARQVVSQAKRELLRLKKERQNNTDGDTEELDAAIAHAKAMERVAKKKVKHLEEEEMAKASGGPCADALVKEEEKEEEKYDEALDEEESEEALRDTDAEYYGEEYELASYDEALSYSDMFSEYEDISMDAMSESFSDLQTVNEAFSDIQALTDEMFEEFSQNMKDMLEEMGLDELSDSLMSAKGDMDPADLKKMVIKHRNKEMKDMVKADADYLKKIFDHFAKLKSGGAVPGASVGNGSGAVNAATPSVSVSSIASAPQVALTSPTAGVPSPMIDISI